MDDNVYSFSEESDDWNLVNEPEVNYSVLNDNFEKDWQGGMSVEKFKKRVLEKLNTVYGQG